MQPYLRYVIIMSLISRSYQGRSMSQSSWELKLVKGQGIVYIVTENEQSMMTLMGEKTPFHLKSAISRSFQGHRRSSKVTKVTQCYLYL